MTGEDSRPAPTMSLATRSFIGLVAGLGLGILISATANPALHTAARWLEPLGTMWVNAIRMTVIPLVVSLMIGTVASVSDIRSIGRLGGRALVLFVLILCAVSIFTMLVAPTLMSLMPFDPGASEALRARAAAAAASTNETVKTMPGFRDWLIALVPTNPIKAAADGTMLPLLVFTVLFALAVLKLPASQRDLVIGIARAVSDAMLRLVGWIVALAPYGVFILLLGLGRDVGAGLAAAVVFYMAAFSLVLLGVILALYPLMRYAGGISYRQAASACVPAQIIALTTRSSLASLPALLEAADRRLHMPPEVAGFVLPLGVSTFKPNVPVGWVIGALFIGQLYGVPVSTTTLLTMTLLSIALSFSVPGIPSGSLFMLVPIFASVGLPTEGIAILIALDVIPDMFKTTCNVTGQMAVAVVLSRSAQLTQMERPDVQETVLLTGSSSQT
jgi:proton glutamate symport protein